MMKTRSRIEYKYYLPQHERANFINDLKKFTKKDKYGQGEDSVYQISSVYFETLGLKSYFDKLKGESDRLKLRVRFYRPLNVTGPIKVELKYRRLDKVIKKTILMSYECVQNLLKSDFNSSQLDDTDPLISYFIKLRKAEHYYPFIRIDYSRNAFFAKNDDGIRVTIDAKTYCSRFFGDIQIKPHIPVLSEEVQILELKCQDYIPFWFVYLIKKYSLQQSSISKYLLSAQKQACNSSLFLK
ncbi:MAG: polyphosphate polymerase domain-containing protein [Candidatus Omnitrophota bacterium]